MTKYERNYIRWYIHDNRNKLLLICVVMFIAMPLLSFLIPGYDEDIVSKAFSGPMIIQSMTYAASVLMLAFGFAVYNFRYLMNKRAITLYNGMPIIKSHFFMIQYALGALIVSVLPFIMYVLAVVIDQGTRVAMSSYLLVGFCIAVLGIAMYTLYVTVIMKCHNLWDSVLVCLGYTFLPVFVVLSINNLMNNALSSSLISYSSSAQEIFPTVFLFEILSIPAVIFVLVGGLNTAAFGVYFNDVSFSEGLYIEGFSYWFVLFWGIVAVLLFFLAKRMYIKRGSEASEQTTSAYMCYPFLSLFVTASFIMLDTYVSKYKGDVSVSISITMVVLSFIMYLIMNFFARRKIQITKDMIFSFGGIVVFVFSLYYLCAASNGFGRIQEFPVKEQISSVSINVDFRSYTYSEEAKEGQIFTFKNPKYTSLNDMKLRSIQCSQFAISGLIDDVYAIQENLVETAYMNDYFNENGNIYIDYVMKDGTSITRSYYISRDADMEQIKAVLVELVDQGYAGSAEEIYLSNRTTELEG